MTQSGELFEYTSGGLKQLGYNVVTLDFKNPTKSSCYNFLQPVIDEIEKGNIAQAQNKASDIVESLVGEAKGEKIWNDGEKSTIKARNYVGMYGSSKTISKYCKCLLFFIKYV